MQKLAIELTKSTAVSMATLPDDFDDGDKDCPVYILGSSEDVDRMDEDFWIRNKIIGVNRTCTHKYSKHMDYWIALDAMLQFKDFCNNDEKTTKFVHYPYRTDPRLLHIHNGYFYSTFDGDKPVNRDFRAGIKSCGHTICSAMSLAYALGYKDIRFRGVNCCVRRDGPQYYDSDGALGVSARKSINAYYKQVRADMDRKSIPELRALGCTFTNESEPI